MKKFSQLNQKELEEIKKDKATPLDKKLTETINNTLEVQVEGRHEQILNESYSIENKDQLKESIMELVQQEKTDFANRLANSVLDCLRENKIEKLKELMLQYKK